VISSGGRRYYVKDGLRFPSVTTILHHRSEYADRNGGGGNAASLGTLIHYAILKQFSKKPIEMPREMIWRMPAKDVHQKIRKAMLMYRDAGIEFQFEAVESPVFYHDDNVMYAGKFDALGYLDGKKSILDLKTGMSYGYYPLQMSAYAHATGAIQAVIVYLDTREDRNPEGVAKVQILDEGDLRTSYEAFKEAYREFVVL
jgi:hypothetical protein